MVTLVFEELRILDTDAVDAVDDRSRGTLLLFAHLNGRPYGTGHKAQREDQQDGGPQEGRDSHLR